MARGWADITQRMSSNSIANEKRLLPVLRFEQVGNPEISGTRLLFELNFKLIG
jgi:hypothetical protein